MALVDYFELEHKLSYLSTEDALDDLGGIIELKSLLTLVNSTIFKEYIKLLESISYRLSRDKTYLRKNHDKWITNLHLIKSIFAKRRSKVLRTVFKLGALLANIQDDTPQIEALNSFIYFPFKSEITILCFK